ncbi:heterokaryon incompatibility protein-domain-containing protein [Scleroderma yunnanense]
MHLVNVKAFIQRERAMSNGEEVDSRTKVIEFRYDETTDYAILSHRWFEQEVDYKEMTKLAKMKKDEQDEIRQRLGYRKIHDSCEQARRDGYEWLWVDTCCIDKRSSAELSEAINSMYRWYENSKICYAYLHDVSGPSFPTESDDERYPTSDGYPEWFSRGWTLQEMIAPNNVQFFNKHWQPIGDKATLAKTLTCITRIPEHILKDGLSSNRPCAAQIMSWAANRKTTRVEDRAYSLLGLLDVNMPMLYGEGKKAFQRLQLEIIRMSNDQSVFAWGFKGENERTGSILADDPSFFWNCDDMKPMDYNEFIRSLKGDAPEEQLSSIEEDRLGTFLITNRGIQIWMFLRPLLDSGSVFEARLPYRSRLSPVRITLTLWNSNYYRYSTSGKGYPTEKTLYFRQVYLRYQDTPYYKTTFEIDDTIITKNGFTHCGAYPPKLTASTFALTSTDPLCVKVYSDNQAHRRFAVGFGQCFGQDWIHVIYEKSTGEQPWWLYAMETHMKMLVRGPEYAQSMAKMRSLDGCNGRLWVKHTCLPGSTRTVRTSCVVWENSKNCGVKIEVSPYPYNGPDEWTSLNVEGTDDPNCDMRGLMMPHSSRNELQNGYMLRVDGVSMEFLQAPRGIKLGDYGCFTSSKDFRCEGNIFQACPSSLISELVITPRHHRIGYDINRDHVKAYSLHMDLSVTLYKPLGLSLPSNRDFNSLLASLSTRLINKYLIVRVIQSPTLDPTTPLCVFAKPFVWHQDEDTGPPSVQWPSDVESQR